MWVLRLVSEAERAALLQTAGLSPPRCCRAHTIFLEAHAHAVPSGPTEYLARQPASPLLLQQLARCLAARAPLILAIVSSRSGEQALGVQSVKPAAYRHVLFS